MPLHLQLFLKMATRHNDRTENEIAHGRLLASGRAESVWGWDSPAGKIRAARRAGLIIEHGRLGPGRYALEIGCGTGTFTQPFAETGTRLVALDISRDLLELAKRRLDSQDTVEFVEGRFESCKLQSGFDAVIGSSVLHHLDLVPALEKIYDLVKPGGTAVFAEPNFMNPQVFLTKKIPFLRRLLGESPDETAFWPWKIKAAFRQAGFDEVKVIPFDWLHPALPETLITAVASCGALLEKVPLVKYFSGSLCIIGRRPH